MNKKYNQIMSTSILFWIKFDTPVPQPQHQKEKQKTEERERKVDKLEY